MGVGEPVMTLARKTSAASIRWLSLTELKASHLATLALDATEPIMAGGANGLNGRAFDGDPPHVALAQASIGKPGGGGDATVAITFSYRRGGGAIEAEATERGLTAPPLAFPNLSLALSAAGVEAVPLRIAGTTAAPTLIPRERFCALALAGATLASTAPGGPQDLAPFELAAIGGAKALIAEACP